MKPIPSSEITPEAVYLSRRSFMKAAGFALAGAALAACGVKSTALSSPTASPAPSDLKAGASTDELGAPLTSYDDITSYNNFYEFSTDKSGIGNLAQIFKTSPWTVEVGGLVTTPKTYSLDDLLTRFTQKEHIYRLRCVEAWSMVIPWTGFALSDLLKEVEPMSSAQYVRFTTVLAPDQMQGQHGLSGYSWPYTEGLRLDEAQNSLTILATGLYGKPLPKQDGAPIRLVVPWKYGFKSIKSIVKIELTDTQPTTFWNTLAPNEYGFYSNVNPNVDHPRWSQASERRIGEISRRPTLMFNGYGDEVASLYTGMDLKVNY